MRFRRLGSSSLPKGHTTTNAADGQNMALTWADSQAGLTTGWVRFFSGDEKAQFSGSDLRIVVAQADAPAPTADCVRTGQRRGPPRRNAPPQVCAPNLPQCEIR